MGQNHVLLGLHQVALRLAFTVEKQSYILCVLPIELGVQRVVCTFSIQMVHQL